MIQIMIGNAVRNRAVDIFATEISVATRSGVLRGSCTPFTDAIRPFFQGLFDGPKVRRQVVSFQNLHLTKYKINVQHSAKRRTVVKAWTDAKIDEQWKESNWAKKIDRTEKVSFAAGIRIGLCRFCIVIFFFEVFIDKFYTSRQLIDWLISCWSWRVYVWSIDWLIGGIVPFFFGDCFWSIRSTQFSWKNAQLYVKDKVINFFHILFQKANMSDFDRYKLMRAKQAVSHWVVFRLLFYSPIF